ncbi:MAG TPA: hypothetical protein VMH20_05755 [Verrucomicrobiae bacterium]|nr:hypothetical protein [Verrucomicrobiae bacterium]
MATASAVATTRLEVSRSTLGLLWILYGIVRLVAALLFVMESAVATLMFGALLSRVGNPYFWMRLFHFGYSMWILLSIIAGIFSLLAGAALLTHRPSARRLALLASFFSVSEIPFGITLGTYTLILFLRRAD